MDADAIEFVLALGRALHRYGTSADRLEETLQACCAGIGLEAEVFTTPTALFMSFGPVTHLKTRLMRLEASEVDLGKLDRVDAVAEAVRERKILPQEGMLQLEEIIASPHHYGRLLVTVMHGVAAGGMAVFFGGSIDDVGLAALIGVALGLLAQIVKRSSDQTRVFELIGAAFAALVASLVSSVTTLIAPSVVTIASLIVLLPGMSLTTAMAELATRHLIAGTARLMSAVIVLLELVIGVALGERIAGAFVTIHHTVPTPLPAPAMWIALVASGLAVSVVFQVQVRAIGWILAGSAVGYLGNIIGSVWLGPPMSAIVGAFALGVVGNLYARVMKRPAQVVLAPAVLLLVPGSKGFAGMTSLLSRDTLTGVEAVFAMFVTAIAIVAGLLIATAVVSPRRTL